MTSKITAILAAAVVLASASVASAQTAYAPSFHNPYHNQDTRNLRFGHANDPQFDPLVECAPGDGQFHAAVLTVCRA